jgi:hypothetical protein
MVCKASASADTFLSLEPLGKNQKHIWRPQLKDMMGESGRRKGYLDTGGTWLASLGTKFSDILALSSHKQEAGY